MCVSIFLVMLHTMVVRVRRPIGFRPPSDQIPSAVQSDSVRRPIGYRSPSDQIPSAVRPSTYAYKSS